MQFIHVQWGQAAATWGVMLYVGHMIAVQQERLAIQQTSQGSTAVQDVVLLGVLLALDTMILW